MSDTDFITPVEVRPGMHVEITQRPWRGVITAPLAQDGTFRALEDWRDDDDRETSWSPHAIGSIRLLPEPLPAEPGVRFWGEADGSPPQWWFVIATPLSLVPRVGAGICYSSASGLIWTDETARERSLVRLQDPEVAP